MWLCAVLQGTVLIKSAKELLAYSKGEETQVEEVSTLVYTPHLIHPHTAQHSVMIMLTGIECVL